MKTGYANAANMRIMIRIRLTSCECHEYANRKMILINMDDDRIIFKELSYQINGVLFYVHNELGSYCNEQQYCDAIEKQFQQKKITYEREKILPPSFDG